MRALSSAPLLLLALPLAACGGGDDKQGTAITLKAESDGANISASADADGRMAIKLPGFEGKLKLPRIQLNAENFDMNGVKLYPNSTITSFDIAGRDKEGDDRVKIGFESPAGADKVRAWFQDQMAQRNFKVQANGGGLSGTTDDGDPFTLDLASAGADKARGTLTVTGRN